MLRLAWAAAVLVWPGAAIAAEPVRHIGIYVQPFYEAAPTPGGKPQVAVGKQYNDLLSSNRREDILAARDLVQAKPALVTPMTMMVLAIRLYDVGLRDDAVFWFYVARERYIVMSEVLDVKTQTLAQADDEMRSFATLAGPIINGYAFCDLAKQTEHHAKAVQWVENNPYEVMFMVRAHRLCPVIAPTVQSEPSPVQRNGPPRSVPISTTPRRAMRITSPANKTKQT